MLKQHRTLQILGECMFVYAVMSAGVACRAEDELVAEWRAVHADALRQIDELAEQYAEQGERELADQIRQARIHRVRGKQLFFLPTTLRPSGDSLIGRIPVAAARRQLRKIHQVQAARLWQLAQQLAKNDPASAYRLAHEVAYLDPDHQPAEHLVTAGNATGNAEVPVMGKSRHKEYGWPAGSYWRVKTDHFLVVTNHSPRAAARAAAVVEEMHNVWRQRFAPLWLNETTLRRALDGARLPLRRRKHKVVVFADRAEYIERLKRVEPQVEWSTGMYRDVAATSYFYMDDPVHIDTWQHELTHQLFQEILQAKPGVGLAEGFWAVEAIALYMESARHCDAGYYQLGGIDARRLQFARYRTLNEQFYLPMAELVTMGKEALQGHSEIRKLYSQAAGMAHFLMDAGPATYRTAFIQSLGDLYRTGKTVRPFTELIDQPLSRLDYGYHEFLKINDTDLTTLVGAGCGNEPDTTLLLLGHTHVTDAGISYLNSCRRMEWLDLTACEITDDAIARLPAELGLQRLTLEATKVTDRTCRLLAKFPQLAELDLSHTAITDKGVAALAAQGNLRSLWLTGTQVTDSGLDALHGLKELINVNVDQTEVTEEGWQQLQKALPRLGNSPPEMRH